MSRRIDSAEFAQLFTEFADPAFRLETLPEYREPHEQDAIRRFTDGRPPDDDWISGYLELSRGARNDGKRLQRVRVPDRHPTDYQRFVMDLASRCNVPAGEDLRVLGRGDALALGVEAGSDFWLFDDRTVALMDFDGTFTGAEIITDVDLVARFRDPRRHTWQAAREFTRR